VALHAFVIVTLEATVVWHSAVAAGAGEVMTTPPAVVPCAVAVLVASSGLGQFVTPEWQFAFVAVNVTVTLADAPPASEHGGVLHTGMLAVVPSGYVSFIVTLVSVPMPVLVAVAVHVYVIDVPSELTVPGPLHDLVTLMPHSGNECGGMKSLSVEVGDVDDRVSAMNVVKQGTLEPKTEFRSMPPSRNSPCANVV